MTKAYVLLERHFEYNDEYYIPQDVEGFHSPTVYLNKETAEAKAKELSKKFYIDSPFYLIESHLFQYGDPNFNRKDARKFEELMKKMNFSEEEIDNLMDNFESVACYFPPDKQLLLREALITLMPLYKVEEVTLE